MKIGDGNARLHLEHVIRFRHATQWFMVLGGHKKRPTCIWNNLVAHNMLETVPDERDPQGGS